jgi:hypothetical protein
MQQTNLYVKLFGTVGHGQRSWLRHYVISRKVAESSPDEVDFYNWPNPSSYNITLGSIQPIRETSTRELPGDKRQPGRKADNLTAICVSTV